MDIGIQGFNEDGSSKVYSYRYGDENGLTILNENGCRDPGHLPIIPFLLAFLCERTISTFNFDRINNLIPKSNKHW